MAKKQLGYVELEWICPSCGTRNAGRTRVCSNCGAAMPKEAKFHAPTSQELDTSAETEAIVAAGPDIVCPFCGTRNRATATECSQCGGDLTGGKPREAGEVVGALQTEPAPPIICPHCGASNPADRTKCAQCGGALGRGPQPSPEPEPAPRPESRAKPSLGLGCLLIALVVSLIIGAILFMSTVGSETIGTVQAVGWHYVIPIEQLQPVQYEGWHDEVPANAEVLRCVQRVRHRIDEPVAGAIEVCGTPYIVDTGTGQGQVVQDCMYEVSDDWCRFSVYEWRVSGMVAEATGSDMYPSWPTLSLAQGQRAGAANEEYLVLLLADDREVRYSPHSLEEYRRFTPGSAWVITTNRLGGVTSIAPR